MLQIMTDHQKLLEHLEKVETKAAAILADREEIIALEKRRNDDRVGMRALQKQSYKKTWITVGPLLLKMPSKTAEELLENGNFIILILLVTCRAKRENILFIYLSYFVIIYLYCRSERM